MKQRNRKEVYGIFEVRKDNVYKKEYAIRLYWGRKLAVKVADELTKHADIGVGYIVIDIRHMRE